MNSNPSPRPSMRHELKYHPEPFEAVYSGKKNFEIRLRDRDYQVGDVLWLRKYHPAHAVTDVYDEASADRSPKVVPGAYTGRDCFRLVTYILDEKYGVQEGYIIMSLGRINV